MLKNKIETIGVLALVGLAIFLRSLVLYDPKGDEFTYISLAHSIVTGEGFSLNGKLTSFFPPLYPFFLSLIFTLWGENIFYAKVAQVILGGLTCVPLYLLGKFLFSKKNAFISTFFFAIHLPLIYASGRLLTETLFSFLLLLFVFFFLTSKKWISLSLCGFFLGLATLTRPSLLYLPLILVIFILYSREYKKFWVILTLALTLLPWTIRNYFVHKHFVLITTYTGYILYNSTHPVDGKKFGFMTPEDDTIKKSKQISSEVERSHFLYREGMKSIHQNPLQYGKLAFLKILFFWVPFDWEMISNEGKAIFNFSYAFIFPFFLIAVFQLLRNSNRGHYFILSLLAYFCLFSIVSYGSPRFRLPLEPYIIVLGVQGLLGFYDRFGWKLSSWILTFFLVFNLHIYYYSEFYKKPLAAFLNMIGLW